MLNILHTALAHLIQNYTHSSGTFNTKFYGKIIIKTSVCEH